MYVPIHRPSKVAELVHGLSSARRVHLNRLVGEAERADVRLGAHDLVEHVDRIRREHQDTPNASDVVQLFPTFENTGSDLMAGERERHRRPGKACADDENVWGRHVEELWSVYGKRSVGGAVYMPTVFMYRPQRGPSGLGDRAWNKVSERGTKRRYKVFVIGLRIRIAVTGFPARCDCHCSCMVSLCAILPDRGGVPHIVRSNLLRRRYRWGQLRPNCRGNNANMLHSWNKR